MCCVKFILALPVKLVGPGVVVPALNAAFVTGEPRCFHCLSPSSTLMLCTVVSLLRVAGLSHLPAANAGLDALERWLRTDAGAAMLPLLDDVLPLLGQLMVKSESCCIADAIAFDLCPSVSPHCVVTSMHCPSAQAS